MVPGEFLLFVQFATSLTAIYKDRPLLAIVHSYIRKLKKEVCSALLTAGLRMSCTHTGTVYCSKIRGWLQFCCLLSTVFNEVK